VAYSPASVQRAVRASALALPGQDPLAVGPGMIQVDGTFAYLMKHQALPYSDVTIASSVPGRGRGLYLREPAETSHAGVYQVHAKPEYREGDPALHRSMIQLELNLAVTTTASWVEAPPYVVLPASGRGFQIAVDPTGLQPGQVHLAFVEGYDTDRPEIGAIFRIPVTVVAPVAPTLCPKGQAAPKFTKPSVRFEPGHIERSFVRVPDGSTWAEISVTCEPVDGGARVFFLHALQNMPHESFARTECSPVFRFASAGEQKKKMAVQGSGTLEVTLAQFWSSLGSTAATISVRFGGVVPCPGTISLSSSECIASIYALAGTTL